MELTINGEAVQLAEATTVEQLVTVRAGQHRSVAVALNGDVVPRSTWPTTVLSAGDTVEVLVAVAGG